VLGSARITPSTVSTEALAFAPPTRARRRPAPAAPSRSEGHAGADEDGEVVARQLGQALGRLVVGRMGLEDEAGLGLDEGAQGARLSGR
jgi:hypothetical protein